MPTLPFAQIKEDYDSMSRAAARVVLEIVRRKPDSVLCVATGASPLGLYRELAKHRDKLAKVRVVKLDEWGGLPPRDPATCETYIREHILGPWGIPAEHFTGFHGDARDAGAECKRVFAEIEELGGIDVCLLGMGADGHLGLNYPGETLPAHVTRTDASTLRHAMLDAAKGTPTHGLTLGLADILLARQIVLVVNGASKAEAVRRLLSGQISTQFPASFLWLHPDVHLFLDREAAQP